MKYNPTHIATYLHNKKKLLYLAVIAGAVILISLGVWIEGKITNSAEQKARIYQTALQVKDSNQLNYSIDTKQGNVFAEVTVNAVDTVKFPEMNKSFPKVRKVEERYTKHEREVCETEYRTETETRTEYDEEGNAYEVEYTVEVPYEVCETETYYEWDYQQEWNESAQKANMSGREYPLDLFALHMRSIDAKDIIDGQTGQYVINESEGIFSMDIDIFKEADEGDLRYSYSVLELPQSGTVFLNVSETLRPVYGHKVELLRQKPQELVKNAQKSAQIQSTVFTIFWGLLVLGELVGLGYVVYQYQEH